eukprot:scaffold420_cov404-Prasinococcus_capsulatus_cf.AAC.3
MGGAPTGAVREGSTGGVARVSEPVFDQLHVPAVTGSRIPLPLGAPDGHRSFTLRLASWPATPAANVRTAATECQAPSVPLYAGRYSVVDTDGRQSFLV